MRPPRSSEVYRLTGQLTSRVMYDQSDEAMKPGTHATTTKKQINNGYVMGTSGPPTMLIYERRFCLPAWVDEELLVRGPGRSEKY